MNRSEFISLKDEVGETILELAYFGEKNFIGRKLPGYEKEIALFPKILLPHFEKASALALKRGYFIKVFDAYRPQKTVNYFLQWSKEVEDRPDLAKHFYPKFSRSQLFNEGYLAEHSSHSLGIAIDLTLVEKASLKELDMGGHFDLFDEISHTHYPHLGASQKEARTELKELMEESGFSNYSKEWWHFSVRPSSLDQYLNFDIA